MSKIKNAFEKAGMDIDQISRKIESYNSEGEYIDKIISSLKRDINRNNLKEIENLKASISEFKEEVRVRIRSVNEIQEKRFKELEKEMEEGISNMAAPLKKIINKERKEGIFSKISKALSDED